MELKVYESLREMFFVTQYAVKLTWRFETGEISHEKILTADIDCRADVRKTSMDQANGHLEQILERIQRSGICVEGAERRFTQPVSCTTVHTPCWI